MFKKSCQIFVSNRNALKSIRNTSKSFQTLNKSSFSNPTRFNVRSTFAASNIRNFASKPESNKAGAKDDLFADDDISEPVDHDLFNKPNTENISVSDSSDGVDVDVANNNTTVVDTWFTSGDPFPTTQFVMDFLQTMHDAGLPWWGAIGLSTFVIRSALVPVQWSALTNSAKLQKAKPMLDPLQKKMKTIKDPHERIELQQKITEIIRKTGFKSSRLLLMPLIQMPLFITMFCALRRLVVAIPEEFSTGGALWFVDLTMQDPMFPWMGGLPVINAFLMCAAFEVNLEQSPPQARTMMRALIYGVSLIFLPLIGRFPAALHVYWFTNNLATLGVAILNRQPFIRNYLGLPKAMKIEPIKVAKRREKKPVRFVEGQEVKSKK